MAVLKVHHVPDRRARTRVPRVSFRETENGEGRSCRAGEFETLTPCENGKKQNNKKEHRPTKTAVSVQRGENGFGRRGGAIYTIKQKHLRNCTPLGCITITRLVSVNKI